MKLQLVIMILFLLLKLNDVKILRMGAFASFRQVKKLFRLVDVWLTTVLLVLRPSFMLVWGFEKRSWFIEHVFQKITSTLELVGLMSLLDSSLSLCK